MSVDIVLVEPEIPQNTGNIARTCVATGSRLHLVEPLGFSVSDRQVKRAGLDYWHDLDLTIWPDLDHVMRWAASRSGQGAGLYYCTTKAARTYCDPVFTEQVILFFGKESRGLPESMLIHHPERCIRIPMLPQQRSLNLSNAVAVAAYEVLRQQGFPALQAEGALTGRL
ncbi:MAG: tRNA (cytidine(34)-2'-O)-methyltransferase [Clostridia bacterium]|nr:tRNA (cytidine(34)-2'-O)-methyltransferase [Eubacteriales bacterium]NCC48183.1 tRNA (cytidine(34)-2'-O)-methyltransferase [Clostridia bacterium]